MSEKLIHIVTVGSYSDENPVALFSQEEEAQQFADLIGGRIITSLPLDGVEMDKPPQGKKFFILEMDRDGNIKRQHESHLLGGSNDQQVGKLRMQHWWVDGINPRRPSKWRLLVNLYADDIQHAAKIANELRAEILAEQRPLAGFLGIHANKLWPYFYRELAEGEPIERHLFEGALKYWADNRDENRVRRLEELRPLVK